MSGGKRTLRSEQKRIRREKKARTRPGRRGYGKAPMLDVMDGHYELFHRLKMPVGPVHNFWTTVHIYARSDLLEAAIVK